MREGADLIMEVRWKSGDVDFLVKDLDGSTFRVKSLPD